MSDPVALNEIYGVAGLYPVWLGEFTTGSWCFTPPPTQFIVCQYCGSQKAGTGPARCLSCGASSWKSEMGK